MQWEGGGGWEALTSCTHACTCLPRFAEEEAEVQKGIELSVQETHTWLLPQFVEQQYHLVFCRGNKDTIQHALKLATEHLELFSDRRGGAPPNSKAAQAVAALDALLRDIPVRDEVRPQLLHTYFSLHPPQPLVPVGCPKPGLSMTLGANICMG